MPSITILPRFCGPDASGNGGYTCGRVAAHVRRAHDGAVEVTLRKPPPLGRPLQVTTDDPLQVFDGEELVAEARAVPLPLPIPPAPSFAEAQALSAHYVGHRQHHFPHCFVCGPARAPGDGLRLCPGRDRPDRPVAAPWIPDASLADPAGVVLPEMLWAALDCPGYFGAAAPEHPVALLGRMTAQVEPGIRAGDRCVVIGWGLGSEGRKLHAATAVFGPDGQPRGRARQTWIRL